MQIMPKRI